ncbi:hypothetical protein PCYB_006870, partial [Plasmodium cynomolgi strain B]
MKNICEQFLKLYMSLTNIINNKKKVLKHNINVCVDYFYNAIESQCESTIDNHLLPDLIYNIEEDLLNNIDKLYNLYAKYTKLNTIINSRSETNKHQLLSLSTKCCTDYIEASYICNPGNNKNNNKFCEKLTPFKSKYEELYDQVGTNGFEFSANFKKLTECGDTNI